VKKVIITIAFLMLAAGSYADEIRPGYLSLEEQVNDVFAITWKQPQYKGTAPLNIQLPDNCTSQSEVSSRSIRGATVAKWMVSCPAGISGTHIAVDGLLATETDVLLQIRWSDSSNNSIILTPSKPSYLITGLTPTSEVVSSYFLFGIEHILTGTDHLLFVFALLLIVTNTRKLIVTITSFTFAHSITLAASTLNLFQLPQQPVEAAIALSIMFLAAEIVHGKRGHPGAAARWPWLIAFIFGLLHGFGFAGALAELGLPQDAIPLALIFFNLGVEAGQLLFVGSIIILGAILQKVTMSLHTEKFQTISVYIIGGLASFWMIQRVAAF
jgi:hydrogenase/urease accessory protein HupE